MGYLTVFTQPIVYRFATTGAPLRSATDGVCQYRRRRLGVARWEESEPKMGNQWPRRKCLIAPFQNLIPKLSYPPLSFIAIGKTSESNLVALAKKKRKKEKKKEGNNSPAVSQLFSRRKRIVPQMNHAGIFNLQSQSSPSFLLPFLPPVAL